MEKTLESLHILNFINNIIKKYIEALEKEVKDNVGENSCIYIGMKSQILILANSFIEEWDKHLIDKSEKSHKALLINLKQKAAPAIRRIRKWDGLREIRNSVLVHNFRNKRINYESVFISDHIDKLIIPDHISETDF